MICFGSPRVLPRLVEAVQLVPFAKDRRLRRVQIFRLAGVEHAAAEADDLAARRVADREHDAIAKPVVAAARVVRDDEARLHELRDARVRGAELLQHRVPRIRRIADAEAARGRPVDAALLQVRDRLLAAAQRGAIDLVRFAQQRVELVVLVLALGCAGVLARYLEPHHLRERFDGFRETRGCRRPSGNRSPCRARCSRSSGRTPSTGSR